LTPILKRWQTVAVVAGAKEGGGQCCKQVVLLVNGEHGRKKAQTESVRRQLKGMQRKVDGSGVPEQGIVLWVWVNTGLGRRTKIGK
jgi:hypothetical protein